MSVSPQFNVRVLPNDVVGQAAYALRNTPYTWSSPITIPTLGQTVARLDPQNPDATDYPDNAGGQTTYGYSMSRAWIWTSRAVWDSVKKRVVWIASPHGFDEFNGYFNAYITLLSYYTPATNIFTVCEAPLATGAQYPHTVGHGFDNVAIAGRVFYKFTQPLWRSGDGYLQPQIAKIDLDALTDDLTSGRQGAAYLGSIPAPPDPTLPPDFIDQDITAGAMDYLPGCNSLVSLHKSILRFYNLTTGSWDSKVNLGFPVTTAFHNIGHYHPQVGKFVGGGGAYAGSGVRNPRFVSVDGTTRTVTALDDSPVTMSMSETDVGGAECKAAATYDPNSSESLFFHDNLNVYGLDTTRAPGDQWRIVATAPVESDVVVAMPDYGCVGVFTSAAAGAATFRLFRGA